VVIFLVLFMPRGFVGLGDLFRFKNGLFRFRKE